MCCPSKGRQSPWLAKGATTGSAATRIGFGATTLHDAFGIPAKSAFLRPLPIQDEVYERLRTAKVIIVDEVSMLSPKTWEFAMFRLLEAPGLLTDIDTMLQQVLFILVGDHAQLPAICHHRPKDKDMANQQVCTSCQLYSSFWWNYVNVHELDIPERHVDAEFAQLIRTMRKERPTQEHLDRVLSSCIITPDDVPALLSNSTLTILCAYNREVRKYNKSVLLSRFALPCIHAVRSGGTGANSPELHEWFHDPAADMLPLVAVGAKVIVLNDVDVKSSVAKGSLATVHALCYDPHGKLVTIQG